MRIPVATTVVTSASSKGERREVNWSERLELPGLPPAMVRQTVGWDKLSRSPTSENLGMILVGLRYSLSHPTIFRNRDEFTTKNYEEADHESDIGKIGRASCRERV